MSLQQYERLIERLQDDEDVPAPPNAKIVVNMTGKIPSSTRVRFVHMAGKVLNRRPWITDSGASDHITCEASLLTEKSNIRQVGP